MVSHSEDFYHACIKCQKVQQEWEGIFPLLDMAECPPLDPLLDDDLNGTFNASNLTMLSPASKAQVERLKFVAYGVLSSVIIAFGIVGNLSNLVVLTRPNLKGVTFVYLTWLAISDLASLLVSLTSMFRLHGMQPRTYGFAVYYAYVEMPLVNAFMASSVFLVCALTVERYFSVCLPTRFKEVHNAQRARCSILAAYGVAFLLYIPVCFQKRPVAVPGANGTVHYVACHNLAVVGSPAFTVYIYAKEVIVRLGPVLALALLNVAIIVAFRRTMRRRRDMLGMASSGGAQHRENSRRYREERRLIVLLAGITVLFFVSMTPAAVLTVLNSDDREFDFHFQLFRAVANVLELLNYAMNFYVYCMCSSEIRRTFVALARCSSSPATSPESASSKPPSVESNNRF